MTNCLLCAIGSGASDPELVAFRTKNVFVVPSIKQRKSNRGQVIICPVSHVTAIHVLEASLSEEVFKIAARVSAALSTAFGAVGTTILINSQAPAQEVEHLHVHVIPRFTDDNLIIPDEENAPETWEDRLQIAKTLRQALA
jgi:histidine triad (HIT) family protein